MIYDIYLFLLALIIFWFLNIQNIYKKYFFIFFLQMQ